MSISSISSKDSGAKVYDLRKYTIFAFLMLNTPRSAHKEIFGAKFLSFERAAITCLRTDDYADRGRSVQ